MVRDENKGKAALGETWTFIPNIQLSLNHVSQENYISATVSKSTSKVIYLSIYVLIFFSIPFSPSLTLLCSTHPSFYFCSKQPLGLQSYFQINEKGIVDVSHT